LASQKSDARIVTSSIKSNNATSGRSRIDNQFRQMPSQIITYLGAVFNLNKGLVLPSENRFLAINQAIADIYVGARNREGIFG
jgi:hypothetical protein